MSGYDNGGIREPDWVFDAWLEVQSEKDRQKRIHENRCKGQQKRREREATQKWLEERKKQIILKNNRIKDALAELKNIED